MSQSKPQPAGSRSPGGGLRLVQGYRPKEAMPLGGYVALVFAFNALFMLSSQAARRGKAAGSSRTYPPFGDLVLLGIATHKLTRTLTKDWVTSPFRAPFVRYRANSGSGELDEESRGQGLRQAIGDLMTCPYCSGPWVALGLQTGLDRFPKPTRRLISLFAAVTVSDFLHLLFEASRSMKDSVLESRKKRPVPHGRSQGPADELA
jgi:hypothetical protein